MVVVCVLTLRLYAPWVHSLKEKRMVVKSLLTRVRSKFNVSAVESGAQDAHARIVLSAAVLAANAAQADSIMEHVQAFVAASTEAEITSVELEQR